MMRFSRGGRSPPSASPEEAAGAPPGTWSTWAAAGRPPHWWLPGPGGGGGEGWQVREQRGRERDGVREWWNNWIITGCVSITGFGSIKAIILEQYNCHMQVFPFNGVTCTPVTGCKPFRQDWLYFSLLITCSKIFHFLPIPIIAPGVSFF